MDKEDSKNAAAEQEMEEDTPSFSINFHPSVGTQFSSNIYIKIYIKSNQFYYSKLLYAHKFIYFHNFKGTISEYMKVLHCNLCSNEELPEETLESPLSIPFHKVIENV